MRKKHSNSIDFVSKKRKSFLQKELFKTLAYSDIFDYPLTGDQLFQFLGVKIDRKKFLTSVKELPHLIFKNTFYYFLPHRQLIVDLRLKRERVSRKKREHIEKFSRILAYIPSILFIGISGSLAMKNADKESDSDIFILTKDHTVWLTRFLVYLLLMLFSVKKQKKKNEFTICANMFLAENSFSFLKEKRNIYTAHEIAQLVPLINKRKTFEKFLIANMWVQKYFPNKKFPQKKRSKGYTSFWFIFIPFEYVSRIIQLQYMQQKKTREITEKNYIAFHPINYEEVILKQYERRILKYAV